MGEAAVIIGAVAALASAATGVVSAQQQASAANEQRRLAEKNAEFEQMEAEESARRLSEENKRTESLSRAMAAASGVGGESQQSYLTAMERKGQREVNWIRKTGSNRSSIIRQEGAMQADAARAQAYASGAKSVAQGTSDVYGWGQQGKWW